MSVEGCGSITAKRGGSIVVTVVEDVSSVVVTVGGSIAIEGCGSITAKRGGSIVVTVVEDVSSVVVTAGGMKQDGSIGCNEQQKHKLW